MKKLKITPKYQQDTKKTLKGQIVSNHEIAPDYFLMEINVPYLGTHSSPGQFVNVKVGENTTDPLLRIPLGVHEIKKRGISLLYKLVGDGTRILSRKKRGEKL